MGNYLKTSATPCPSVRFHYLLSLDPLRLLQLSHTHTERERERERESITFFGVCAWEWQWERVVFQRRKQSRGHKEMMSSDLL